ncbi:MAG: hypothetical protein N5P05_003072 [Chroococcopsis gigantea SAG 12.99]|jgi:predicted small secreted protein|nr:methyl-accepting chemotaxis protein [Chlorogloea purpurea SAG 13.99]MDV3001466.1 hypothetical protein [Chroococcopsis gigantea SAG 12.99]
MFDWLKLLPPGLVWFTGIVVILPTFITILIRINLYSYLDDATDKINRLIRGDSRGKQPPSIERLEDRFKRASSKLDTVNTTALVDSVYGDEKFNFLGFSPKCEQWDYFTRVLPNLLLAFGLLGTFLGITLNLTNMSGIISQSSGNSDKLIQSLQTPLQSMGIAFITSLIGLICSSLLTVINLMFNTSVARNKLLATLEDYLDNILSPEVSGDSRLDKAVNRMVDQQQEFLQRFHENVTKAVESSLGAVAKQIAQGNKEAADLAKQVYDKLSEVSGSIRAGADIYNQSAYLLKDEVAKISTIVQHENFINYSRTLENTAQVFAAASNSINNSEFGQKLINATTNLDNTQQKLAHTVNGVKELIASIDSAVATVTESSNTMVNFGQDIKDLSESSLGILTSDTRHLEKIREELSTTLEKQTLTYQALQDLLELAVKNTDVQTVEIQQLKQLISENQNRSTAIAERLNNLITQESSKFNHSTRLISEDLQKALVAMRSIESYLSQQSTPGLGNGIKNSPTNNGTNKSKP